MSAPRILSIHEAGRSSDTSAGSIVSSEAGVFHRQDGREIVPGAASPVRSAVPPEESAGTVVVLPDAAAGPVMSSFGSSASFSAESALQLEAIIGTASSRYSFQVANISTRGFFVSAGTHDVDLIVGTSYQVEIVSPARTVKMRARLVHVGDGRRSPARFGFRITMIDRQNQLLLTKIVNEARGGGPGLRFGLNKSWALIWGLFGTLMLLALVAVILAIVDSRRTVVDVAVARQATVDEVLSSGAGEIVARRSATLRSPLATSAPFEASVEPGATVKAGDVLAKAADPAMDGSRVAAEGKIATAEARVQELRAHGESAKLSAAQAELARARAAAREAGKGRTIVAPFDGVVVDVHARGGELIAAGGPVIEMIDASELHANVPFGEADAARINVGMPAKVVVPGMNDVVGTVDGMGIVVRSLGDGRNKSVLVQVSLQASSGARPGSTARAEINLPERTALLVPSSAVVREGADAYVWTVTGRSSGLLEKHVVRLGSKIGGRQEIEDGVTEGSVVVRDGQLPWLERGMQVKVSTTPTR